MAAPWQVITDCGHCHTTGAVLELMDPAHPGCHLGVPISATCRMCGESRQLADPEFTPRDPFSVGRCPSCRKPLGPDARVQKRCGHCGFTPEVHHTAGLDCTDRAAVRTALSDWASTEGLTIDELCEGSLGDTVAAILDRYVAGEPVESSLDAIAFLFPGMAAGSALGAVLDAPKSAVGPPREPVEPDPRAPVKLLVSVMVADGQIRSGERAFVEAFLTAESLDPLSPLELRPWRPHEVGHMTDRDLCLRAVKAAVELMHLDGERDGSEIRIVRTFARAWGIPETQVEDWNRTFDRRYAPPLRTMWRALSRWVRTR